MMHHFKYNTKIKLMNNLKKLAMVTAILMLPIFVASSFAQKKVSLSYKLEQGKTFDVLTEIDQEISFETNGQVMILDQVIATKSVSVIDNTTSEDLTIKTSLGAIRTVQSIFGMEIVYDSEDEATKSNPMAEQMSAAFEKLLGASYSTVIDTKGNVLKYDLGEFANNEEMTNNISSGNSYIVFPDGKVSVNDTWEADIKPLDKSDMKVSSKYTLIKASKKSVTVGVVSTISANNMDGEDMKMEGTIIGELLVNPKTGWTVSSTMEMEIEMEMVKDDMKFPASISGDIVMTSTEK
jgi:hypothetical protein